MQRLRDCSGTGLPAAELLERAGRPFHCTAAAMMDAPLYIFAMDTYIAV